MIPTAATVHGLLRHLLDEWERDGHEVAPLREQLGVAGSDLDVLAAVAGAIENTPVRPDWPWDEPDTIEAIEAASTADRSAPALPTPGAQERIRTAFLGRVAGCVLGKPLELGLSRAELEPSLRAGECWPLDDYLPEAALDHLPERQEQWRELVRERITHVAEDDDLNYTVVAMLALEEHGRGFTHDDLARLWRRNLPVAATFGPERARLAGEAAATLLGGLDLDGRPLIPMPLPGADLCGALIRADAYGYACPGDPAEAARLAHRDATFTHRRTGVYGAMWVAATTSLALALGDPLEAARQGLGYVPTRSRFHAAVTGALEVVETTTDWSAANDAVVARHPDHGHCRVLQEVGTLVVTLGFARDVGHGICLQVMQANDTDSFGATAGSILGAALGPDALDERWLAPFRDRIHLAMALVHDTGLHALADRMARLPSVL